MAVSKIDTRKKRRVIYDALGELPNGLSRIVVEYAISVSELLEEYALTCGYEPRLTTLWDKLPFQMEMWWHYKHKYHILKITYQHTDGNKYSSWYDDFRRHDNFIHSVIIRYLGSPFDSDPIVAIIGQMVNNMMTANSTRT